MPTPDGAEEDDVLGAFDEGQAGELVDLLPGHTGRKAEVKAVERLYRRETSNAGEHLAGSGPAGVTLGAQDFLVAAALCAITE